MGPQRLALTATPAPSGNLNGKIAYMNAGHGWTWGTSSWATQRPEYSEIVFTGNNNDTADLKAHHIDEKKEKQIRKDFAKAGKLPKVLIVTERLWHSIATRSMPSTARTSSKSLMTRRVSTMAIGGSRLPHSAKRFTGTASVPGMVRWAQNSCPQTTMRSETIRSSSDPSISPRSPSSWPRRVPASFRATRRRWRIRQTWC